MSIEMIPEIELESRHGNVTNIYAVFPDGDKKEIQDNDFLDYINEKKTENGCNSVNHPKHYNSHPSGIECIEVARWYDFDIGNALKYLWRHGLKHEEGKDDYDKAIEDLEKAKWYIEDEIRMIRKKQSQPLQQ